MTDSYFAAHARHFYARRRSVVCAGGCQDRSAVSHHSTMRADQRTGFNHTLIVLEEGAKATLIEDFASADRRQHQAMYNGAVEIVVAQGCATRLCEYPGLGPQPLQLYDRAGQSGRERRIALGDGWHWRQVHQEPDRKRHAGATWPGADERRVFCRQQAAVSLRHAAESSWGRLARAICCTRRHCAIRSRTVWRGNIRVFPTAQKTDAYQANRNLQLSTTARGPTRFQVWRSKPMMCAARMAPRWARSRKSRCSTSNRAACRRRKRAG